MDALLQDLRYGVQTLLKNPGFTVVAVLALALGIGANTAIFSVLSSILLRPLPYQNPDQLVMVWEVNVKRGGNTVTASYPNFADWRDQNKAFDGMAAYVTVGANITEGADPEPLTGAAASANVFDLLGVKPALGRTFLPEDAVPGPGETVVVLSHGLWQRRFGADPNIIGRVVRMNGSSPTVVGVMPPDFQFPPQFRRGNSLQPKVDVWAPLRMPANVTEGRGSHAFNVIGRLKPGVTLGQAQADLDNVAMRLEQEYPNSNKDGRTKLIGLHQQVVGDIRPILLILFGAVFFVLLIACANVANLLLARSSARRKEIAVRAALGASRMRIVRQLITESVLLSGLGGALGLLLAYAGVKLLVTLSSDPRLANVGIYGWPLAFTLLVSLLTGLIFGLAPALQASKPDLNETLKESSRGASTGISRNRLRSVLVVAEVSLALVLLLGAGLMLRGFMRLQDINPGFNTENVLTMGVSITGQQYAESHRVSAFYQELIERVKALPGAEAVGAVNVLPLSGGSFSNSFNIDGRPKAPGEIRVADYRAASPDYFRVMDIPLIKGRAFSDRDGKDAPGVAVINDTLARRYFPNEDPLGKRVFVDTGVEMAVYGKAIPREIIGVVGDVRHASLDAQPKPEIYVPFLQNPQGMTLVVRTKSEPGQMSASVRNAVAALDKDQLVYRVKTMDQLRADSLAQWHFFMLLLGVFAVAALILAIVGVYGVISYSVSQRRHELGIRLALGAGASDILRLVIRQGMVLVLLGIGIGLVAAIALNRVIFSVLAGIPTTDPVTYAAVSLLLIAVAMVACFLPAHRATKIDPITTLREE